MTASLLDTITSPKDLRALSVEQFPILAEEIRSELIRTIGETGGHLASNLGVVELTLALHRVFDFARDYLVFDVGHQCYTHKLITGRREHFGTLRQKDGISGFPDPAESPYDLFKTGHASASVSTALGLVIASRLRGEDRTGVVVIGDGSIGGGMSFEALNHAGQAGENLLVILNDNDMAISPTVGAVSGFLSRIRSEPFYQRIRQDLRTAMQKIPYIGSRLGWVQEALVDALKDIVEPAHLFTDLGFRYFGPVDGHDSALLLRELEHLKAIPGPRLLHVVTHKGKGFDAALQDPERYHSASPFAVLPDGSIQMNASKGQSYTAAFGTALMQRMQRDDRAVVVTAAMPGGTGTSEVATTFPGRTFDVGISEEHAVALAGGMAKAGQRPAVCVYATFLQRGYDQIFHDVCLQNLGVVFCLDRAGLVGSDGPTHHGVFDIAMLRHLPNMTLLAPSDADEMQTMLDFAFDLGTPVAIRYPRGNVPEGMGVTHAPLKMGLSETLREGRGGAILAYGSMVPVAMAASDIAAREGVSLTVVNLRFAKPLDAARILELAGEQPFLMTVEDHALAGGVGSAVAELLADRGVVVPLQRCGVPDAFISHATCAQLHEDLGLTASALAAQAVALAKTHGRVPSAS